MRIALVQTNPVVGDIEGNLGRVQRALDRARASHADLAVLHELVLSGYPPQDLLERRDFIAECEAALARLVEFSSRLGGMGIVVGVPLPASAAAGKTVANSAVLIAGGRILHRHDAAKVILPEQGAARAFT